MRRLSAACTARSADAPGVSVGRHVALLCRAPSRPSSKRWPRVMRLEFEPTLPLTMRAHNRNSRRISRGGSGVGAGADPLPLQVRHQLAKHLPILRCAAMLTQRSLGHSHVLWWQPRPFTPREVEEHCFDRSTESRIVVVVVAVVVDLFIWRLFCCFVCSLIYFSYLFSYILYYN
jgi:hypothetical protein